MKNLQLSIGWVFSAIGSLAFIGGLYVSARDYAFASKAQKALGRVSRVDLRSSSDGTLYCPVLEYTFNGKTIEISQNSCSMPATFQVGESVEILFDPSKPNEAKVNSFMEMWFESIVLFFIGLVFTLLGSMQLRAYYIRKRLKAWLERNGEKILVKISQVRLNTQISVNGKHPFVIECQWNDQNTGKVITAVSEDLWFNPDLSGHARVGSEIEVMVDPKDATRNYIKIDHLTKILA